MSQSHFRNVGQKSSNSIVQRMLFKLKGTNVYKNKTTRSTHMTLKLHIYGSTSSKLVKASLHCCRPKCQNYRMKVFINGALQLGVLPLMLIQWSKAQLLFITEYFKINVLLNTNWGVYMSIFWVNKIMWHLHLTSW